MSADSDLSNPLKPNMTMYILHTVLYTFCLVSTRRIYLKIKTLLSSWLFSLL